MKILFAFPVFERYEAAIMLRLGSGHQILFRNPVDRDSIWRELPDTEILVSNIFPPEYGALCRRLRLLHAPGAGLDKIDFGAVPETVRVCRCLGHGPAIAEYAMMVMLALSRSLLRSDWQLRHGRWAAPQFDRSLPLFEPLAGKTAVILGTGEIGGCLAEKCRAFSMRAIGISQSGRPAGPHFEEIHPAVELQRLLPLADFLILAIPLSSGTRGIIGNRELSRMKPSAYLVNLARGPVLDEDAIFAALSQRRLAGAALDVWYQYPAPGSNAQLPSRLPFWQLDNVIMTPHVSGMERSTFERRVEDILFNIEALVQGLPLRHEVGPDPY